MPEILRPALRFFPSQPAEARALAAHHSAAALAADIGWPRGDLWTDKSLTTNAALVSAFEDGRRPAARAASGAYATAETAARLAPSDARAWLLLAMDSAHAHNGKAFAQLKMSYYTDPYSEYLFPLRIQVAAQLPQVNDKELQGFLLYELKTIIHDKPALKQSIASAYRAATPATRQFFETTLATLDAKLLAQLRSANP